MEPWAIVRDNEESYQQEPLGSPLEAKVNAELWLSEVSMSMEGYANDMLVLYAASLTVMLEATQLAAVDGLQCQHKEITHLRRAIACKGHWWVCRCHELLCPCRKNSPQERSLEVRWCVKQKGMATGHHTTSVLKLGMYYSGHILKRLQCKTP